MMNPLGLFNSLLLVEELEKKISKKKKLEFGDKDIIQYNNLVNSFNSLSIDELVKHQRYIIDKKTSESGVDYNRLDEIRIY